MKDWLAARIPKRECLLATRWLRPFAHRLTHPSLWKLNRWTVARGVALGFFAGLLLPFGQTPVAALLALTARANLIVAAAATFITNPVTNAPIFYGAYKTGRAVLGTEPGAADPAAGFISRAWLWLADVSGPTALGLLIFAVAGGAIGYLAAQFGWRLWVGRRWSRRRRARAAA